MQPFAPQVWAVSKKRNGKGSMTISSMKYIRNLWTTPDEILDSDSEDEDEVHETNFETIISDMVATGYAEGHPTDSISLEIKSFKFAQNKVQIYSMVSSLIILQEYSDCVRGLVPALLQLVIKEQSATNNVIPTPKLIKGLKDMFSKGMWGQQLLSHFLQDQHDRSVSLPPSLSLFLIKLI